MQAQEFIEKLYQASQAQGINQFQIDYSQSENLSLKVMDGKIEKRSFKNTQHLSFSIKEGQNIGSFDCGELEEKNIPLIIKEAKENALLMNNEEENFFFGEKREYPAVKRNTPIKEYETLDKEKFLLDLEKTAYTLDKRVKKVISCYLNEGTYQNSIRNSLDLNVSEGSKWAFAGIYLSVEENGVIKTASEYVKFDKKEDLNSELMAQKVVEKALKKLNPISIPSGKYKIVFENECFADFLDIMKNLFSATAVEEKHSKFGDKLKQKVAADGVTLVDNPLLDNGYRTSAFDGEGYPSQINVIIKNGVLQTLLHNLRTAHKFGVTPTGNGIGGGARGVSYSNFYLENGNLSKDEILQQTKEGVYITDLTGTHAGYSSVSGDFSFGAEGFLIKDGKIDKALNQLTISGNVYELWQDIELIGNDLKFTPDGCGSPTIAVKPMQISCN